MNEAAIARYTRAMELAPMPDMTHAQARQLIKAGSGQGAERKRGVPNVFSTVSGAAQPRQGFLSTEIMRAIYLRSELVRMCVDTLIETVLGASWTVRPVDSEAAKRMRKKDPEKYLDQQRRIKWLKDFFMAPNSYEDLDSFHRRLLRDLLIFDAGAYEVIAAEYPEGGRLPIELGVVAGDTIELETDAHGIITTYWQSYNVSKRVEYEFDELAYLQLNVCSWQPYGLSAIETAWMSISSDLNATNWNTQFFTAPTIPPGLLAVLGVSRAEFQRIMAQMRNTAQDNPFNLFAFQAARDPNGNAQKVFDFVPLNQVTNREMQFQELLELVTRRICAAFKVTPSQIGITEGMGGGIGNGIAEQQADLFQNKGIAPLLKKLERSHTYNVIHNICGWNDLEFKFELTNTPAEQAEYSRSLQEVQSGIKTVNEHRAQFGGRKSLDWGDLPLVTVPGYQPPMSGQQLGQQAGAMGQPPGGAPPGGAPGQPLAPPGGAPGQPPAMQKSAAKRIVLEF
jgi:Phage portal protein